MIDPKTGKYPEAKDMQKEDWYPFDSRLRLGGFLLDEDCGLALSDRCGNIVYPPQDRFQVAIHIGNAKHYIN